MAHSMTPNEFRVALADIGYSQERFAELVGASGRTGQKWALGETRLPNAVVILLRIFQKSVPNTYDLHDVIGDEDTHTLGTKASELKFSNSTSQIRGEI